MIGLDGHCKYYITTIVANSLFFFLTGGPRSRAEDRLRKDPTGYSEFETASIADVATSPEARLSATDSLLADVVLPATRTSAARSVRHRAWANLEHEDPSGGSFRNGGGAGRSGR